MKNKNWRFLLPALCILVLQSCLKDGAVNGDGSGSGDGSVSVLLSLEVPGTGASTRALTAAQEDAIKTVDVFVFDSSDRLVDWRYGTMNVSGNGFTAQINVSPDNTALYRLMVLANARSTTYTVFRGSPNSVDNPGGDDLGGHANKTYAQVYALLAAAIEQKPSDSTTDIYASNGIPMWGMMKEADVINYANRSFSMDMLRSVAMIDVGTNPSPAINADGSSVWAEHPNFSLEAVYLYNASSTYSVAPAEGNYNYTTKKATALSLPSGISKFATANAIEYSDDKQSGTVTRTNDDKGYAIASAIYAAEANVIMGGTYGDDEHLNRTALVVAGYYSPDPDDPNTDELSYYRIDFAPGGTLTDLLRNNAYQVTIKTVSGSGSKTKEEAFTKYNADLTVVIKTWIPSAQDGTTVDGEYYLKVNPYDFKFDKWAKSNQTVTVQTNVAASGGKSWSATVEKYTSSDSAPDWLTIVSGTGSGVSGGTLRFGVAQVPAGSPETFSRSARLRFVAGSMTHDIIVEQSGGDAEFMLRLSHSELTFAGRKWDEENQQWVDPDPQTITVNWSPTKWPYYLSLTDYTGGGVDMATAIPNDNDTQTLTISPAMISDTDPNVEADPFFERSSRLGFTAYDQDKTPGTAITKQLLIRQVFYSIKVDGTKDYYYQGKTYTFNIKSNTAWKAVVTGDYTIFSDIYGTSGQGDTSTPEVLGFAIKSSATVGSSATITFSNDDDLFPPQSYTIVVQNVLPNSYIVSPGSPQQIPVSKAYRVWMYDRDLQEDLTTKTGTRGAKLLWQDEQGLIPVNGVNLITVGADETQSIIYVQTTSGKSGNAVVAFTIDDEIYWSWHLWVTSYNPWSNMGTANNYAFMDRNLGAMGNSGYAAYGMHYQGGRTNPLPPGASMTTNDRRTIYDINNTELAYDQPGGIVTTPAAATGGLPLAIKNPMTFYRGTYGNGNWYGVLIDVTERWDFWWDGGRKCDYDPCPAGWMVMRYSAQRGMENIAIGSSNPVWNGIYFPSQGAMSYNTGILNSNTASNTMYVWFTQDSAIPLMRQVTNGTNTTNGRQSSGVPVRCTRE